MLGVAFTISHVFDPPLSSRAYPKAWPYPGIYHPDHRRNTHGPSAPGELAPPVASAASQPPTPDHFPTTSSHTPLNLCVEAVERLQDPQRRARDQYEHRQ